MLEYQLLFALGSWEGSAGVSSLRSKFSGFYSQASVTVGNNELLSALLFLKKIIKRSPLCNAGVWCCRKNPKVSSRSISEAKSGMCCFFQSLFLTEVGGIRLVTWELRVLASTTAWEECGET